MGVVVVGFDGSETSRLALGAAVDQAEIFGHRLLVVHVIGVAQVTGYEYTPVDITHLTRGGQVMVDDEIAALRASRDDFDVPIETKVVVGHVGVELLGAATSGEGAAMVVVGSRGLGGFKSLLLGSVTSYLTHHIPCPLLIIPAPDRK